MQDGKLGWYINTVTSTQFRPVAGSLVSDALTKIGVGAPLLNSQPLQLLALRRYLRLQYRDGRDLASIWSWTAEQVESSLNQRNADGAAGIARRLLDEAARVQRAFAASNPGYSLSISPPRSLERQITLWNSSLDARTAATRLFEQAVREVSKPGYDLPATMVRVVDFRVWLQESNVSPEPGNAAPGTSGHGQMRAVDFIVMQGRTVIATTQRSTIPTAWTASGWAARLAAATAGTSLVGPLATPYEPWHWSLR